MTLFDNGDRAMDEDFTFPEIDLTPSEAEMERWAALESEVDVYASVDRFMEGN